jgi:hypothetical protein
MTQNSLVGTWKLLSLEFRFEDGQVIYPFGKTPIGYLIYTEQGYISVNIMNANRSPFSSEDITKLSKEEKAAAFETCVAYGGQYEIKGEKHKNGRAKDLGALTVVAIRKDWASQATAKSPPEQVSSEKKRQLQAANEHREKEKKQLETLKSTFNEKRREKVETLIASWEGDRLSAEIEEYIESKSPEVKSLIRQWYEKYGFDSPFFKPAFRVYLSKKYLPKEEHDFVTWARARGSSVEGNKEGVRSLKSIGDVLKDVVPKIDDRH